MRPVSSRRDAPDERRRILVGRAYEPLRRLVDAAPEESSGRGAALVTWLNEQPAAVRDAAARELSDWLAGAEWGPQRIAALEVLVRSAPGLSVQPLRRTLGVRPIEDLHIYPLAFARSTGVDDHDGQTAASIVSVLNALPRESTGLENAAELAVEAFVSLAAIAPRALLANCSSTLREARGFEQTRLLDAVAEACRKLPTEVGEELRRTVDQRWHDLLRDPTAFDDVPGIGARILEIKGRCDLGLPAALRELEGTQLEHRVLYQLLQRQMDFLTADARADLAIRTITLLAAKGHLRTFRKAIELPVTNETNVLTRLASAIARGP
jgi:hypothetical protein